MNLISLSIKRPVFAWILMSALIIFGAISMNRMGISQLPDVDFPILTVSVNYQGASPEVIESEILDPIEQKLLGVEGLLSMKSSARQNQGSVTLEFDIKKNVDVSLQEVQAALSQLRLPPEIDPPTISKQNPEDSPIMFIAVSSDKPMKEIINWTENYLLDQFRFIPGIGEVSISGFSLRNMRIWPDPKKLKQYDLTVLDLMDALQTQHIESAAGQYVEGDKEYRTRWLGEATSPEQIANIKILKRGGQNIQNGSYKINSVADVEDGLSDVRRMARDNKEQAIAIQVRKMRGGNEVTLAESVHKKVAELQKNIPEGYKLRVAIDFTRPTSAVVFTTFEKLVVAAIITILICFLFLGNLQSSINILFSIPTSIVGTFLVLYFSGFTLNLFTLLALTLAISIVVDDAIMLLENIVRHHRMGKSAAQASYDGSMEILPAATAASLAVVAVFIPVVFMSGVTGKFFFQFGITISSAVLLSLLEAVTITPMRAAAFLSDNPKATRMETYVEHLSEKASEFYRKILTATLKWPWTITLSSLGVFILSLLLAGKVNKEFVPAQDQDIIIATGQTAPGSSLETTSEAVKKLEAIVGNDPDVVSTFVSIGAGGPAAEVNQFFMPIYLKDRTKRKINHLKIIERLREQVNTIKGLRVNFRDLSARGLTSGRLFPVSFNLTGPDLNLLSEKSKVIAERLTKEGLAQDMDTDFKLGLPELLLYPDREAMAARAVSIDNVAKTLAIAVGGNRNVKVTSDGRRYDINVKVRDDRIRSIQDIEGIFVRNNYGNLIPLSQLVKAEQRKTYQSIIRYNRQRTIGVYGGLPIGQSQAKALDRAQEIAREELPAGYGFILDGAAAGLNDSFKSLLGALLLGILVAYMILAVQFNSFIHPLTVLVALPFSITGALLILWLSGVSLNLFSYIGIIVLMGIAKKNSILLVEFTNHVRQHQKDVKLALIEGCPVRLRPILMTSVATIAAALPLIIGNSIGQETRTPMGLAIIGGTIVSTIFTLLVVPSLYYLLAKLESKKAKAELRTAP
jgi:hydrophobe/amphiphile efflux-1 (HAE1) family protein